MNTERFDRHAAAAVEHAFGEARRLGHPHIGTEHVLLGLLAQHDDTAAVLDAAGATLDGARYKADEAVGRRRGAAGVEPELTARANRALDRASRFSLQRHAPAVGTDHVLLGVLDVEGTACQVLRGLGVDVVALRATVDNAGAPSERGADAHEIDERALRQPVCPSCGVGIDAALAHRTVRSRDEASGRDFLVVFCASCGSALGVSPA